MLRAHLVADNLVIVLDEPVGQLGLVNEARLRLGLLALEVDLLEDLQLLLRTGDHLVDEVVVWYLVLLLVTNIYKIYTVAQKIKNKNNNYKLNIQKLSVPLVGKLIFVLK